MRTYLKTNESSSLIFFRRFLILVFALFSTETFLFSAEGQCKNLISLRSPKLFQRSICLIRNYLRTSDHISKIFTDETANATKKVSVETIYLLPPAEGEPPPVEGELKAEEFE